MKTALLIATACLLGLLSTIGAALPYPILPPLFAADAANNLNHFLGLPPKLLFSLALAINPLGLLIGAALQGPLSDRYGRRPVLITTALGAAAGHALTALALLDQSYPLFMLARFATGLMEGNGPVTRAMLADRLEGDLKVRAFSWLNGAMYMGWLVGPMLAATTMGWGLTVPFWAAVVALLVLAGLVATVLPREAPSASSASWWQVARDQHALNLLRHAELRTLFIVQLAYTCGLTAFYEFYPLWLVEFAGFNAHGIAWATAALCGVMTLSSVFAGRPSKAEPLPRASLFAFAAAAMLAMLLVGDKWLGLAAIALFGLPNAYYSAIVPAWSSTRFGHHGQGAVMGLLATTFCLANIMVALAGAALTLVDTRLILLLGASATAWAAWRIGRWRLVHPATIASPQPQAH